jgi:sugar lactone lactonase YvrE
VTSTTLAILSAVPSATAQRIFTVAGGYVGDGKPATSAAIGYPQFAALDLQGNLLIGDAVNCRIRKVDSRGIISTIAGTGICGFGGDGKPATKAKLSLPTGIAVDSSGNVYFGDQNTRVRKIDSAGTITTIAGNGKGSYCGDGKQATKACLNFPGQLAIGTGSAGEVLYIADTFNERIRQVVLRTGIISTVAGDGNSGYFGDGGPAKKAEFSEPVGVAFEGKTHTLWISDTNNSAIRPIDLKTGIITTFFGPGPCRYFEVCVPEGLTTDASGNLHVADVSDSQVFNISVPSQSVSVDAGISVVSGFNGDGIPANTALLSFPSDVLVNKAGDVLIVEAGNGRIRKGSGTQIITTVAGGFIGDGKPATSAALSDPEGMAFDAVGNFYIADAYDHRIRKITPSGKISTFAGNGISAYSGDGGPAKKASLNFPDGLAVDSKGDLFIADRRNFVIRKVSRNGFISTFSKVPFFGDARSMTLDAQGNLYVADSFNCVILKVAKNGTSSVVAGAAQCGYNADEIPATQALLREPYGVAVDFNGNLYIGDTGNARIRMVDTSGIIHTVAGNGHIGFGGDGGPATSAMLYNPQGVAIDSKGDLLIADSFNCRLRMVNRSGIIETIAGSGQPYYNGNGLLALKTNMIPYTIAVSPSGEILLADPANNRVRKIQ